MSRYLTKRIAQSVLTFFIFLTAIFFMLDAQPGDFGSVFLNDPRLTAEQRQTLRANLGLDKPVGERYLSWMGNFLRGDLGISFSNYPRPVVDVISERAPRTIVLFLSATIVAFYVGFLAGKVLAWRRGGVLEYAATLGGVGLFTVFTPWFGLMMIWIFAFNLKIFPIGKFIAPELWRGATVDANSVFNSLLLAGIIGGALLFAWTLYTRRRISTPAVRKRMQTFGVIAVLVLLVIFWIITDITPYVLDILHHLLLPILTLTLISFAGTMLLTRNSMLETLREDYVQAARAKGLPDKVVRDKHAARNALLPVVTSLVFGLATVLDGGALTETVFSWPGMGRTLLTAAQLEDIPMTVGVLVFTGALALLAHLVVDVLYTYLDPRIRYA